MRARERMQQELPKELLTEIEKNLGTTYDEFEGRVKERKLQQEIQKNKR